MKQKIGDWPEDVFKQKVEEVVEEKLKTVKPYWVDKMQETLDKMAGDYKKVDEEQTLLSGKQSEHSDAIEELDTRVTTIEHHLHL